MNICIQKYRAMKKLPNPENEVLSIRIRGAVAMRFYNLCVAVADKNGYAEKTDVIRELLGLDEPNLLTAADIDFFRTGKKQDKTIINKPIARKVADEKIKMIEPKPPNRKEDAA